jgi:hypothetical protein
MATFEFTSPEGKKYTVEGPAGATQEQAFQILQSQLGGATAPKEEKGLIDRATDFVKQDIAAIPQRVGNLVAGGVRGAGSIGATIAAPYDIAKDAIQGKGLTLESNRERRADMTGALAEMGADPNSPQFQGSKFLTEVAGTAGAGGLLAKGVQAVPGMNALAKAIQTGGFSTGASLPAGAPISAQALNWLTRMAGGGISGGATAGLVDPEMAGTGAAIGTALPPAAKLAGAAGNFVSAKMEAGAKRLMQSAIKPTIAQLKSGDADTAVNMLLERGINPTAGGVNKLRALIDDTDNQITTAIAGSPATIDKQNVLNRLTGTRSNFTNQVSPTADLSAIQGVADDFAAHPSFAGGSIPVQGAQELKKGTYKVLAKKYGQQGAADVEAQKALARGLKEEIATAVPGIQGLNAEQSKLLTTLDVAERRALMEMNKNPMGLAALAGSPASWAMFMADKSALFKSLAARMINSSSGGAGSSLAMLGQSAANPLVRNALVRPAAVTSEAGP